MVRGILLVVIDCLRADHCSAYGYGRATTPTVDQLAERGVLWEQAHSVSSWTKPSVTSMLTGLYPSQHGAFEGIKRSKGRAGVTTDVLPPTVQTLAQVLARHGWRCGAFLNNAQLGEFSGLNVGFESYAPGAGKADRLIASFREWLQSDPRTRFFAYLHFLEAHWPYKPRRRHVKMFGGDRDANEFTPYSARDYGRLRRAIARGEASLSSDQLEQMVQMYDAAVRRLDGRLKLLLAFLKELGLDEDVVLIVTADHGEEFLDHGRIGHGHSLFDELTHVPLVMSGVPGLPCPLRRPEPVSLVDLPRTILGLAGAGGELPGRDLLADAQQSPAAAVDPGCEAAVLAELRIRRRYTQSIRTSGWKLVQQFIFQLPAGRTHCSELPHALLGKLPHERRLELYDLRHDPLERDNLAGRAEVASLQHRLEGELETWWRRVSESAPKKRCADVELQPQIVARLRDLGYLD